MKRKLFKSALKIFGSGVLVEYFDKNEDGKVSWKEVRSAPADVWAAFLVDVGGRVAMILLFKGG